ncbi:histidine ammonia-lyase [Streptomyces sp. Ru62]|uniref:aromatic amino acid ammonia-lyase n=1 Tax=Streptomyces sp. Ru62 TaxID=2080745 RepID=UPI000CDDD27E|nr:aromatic amino acid ammonia-lyase [Streptomyces sp. Ru62]POX63244.1 histidine ammonia-lyase [Streptomyces sp. Ru62]
MDLPTRVPSQPGDTRVPLDGGGLTLPALIRLADGTAVPALDPGALDRVRRARETADRLAATGRWYGRGTGVGAHRSVAVDPAEETAHGLRLLRSHAGGAGPLLPARTVRAMLAIRANQLLAGGSGIHPSFVTALTDALRLRVHPAVNEYGGVGTGDLTALAQTGLTLLGERPWLTPDDSATPPHADGTVPTGEPAGAGPELGVGEAPGGGSAGGDVGTAEWAAVGSGAGPAEGPGGGALGAEWSPSDARALGTVGVGAQRPVPAAADPTGTVEAAHLGEAGPRGVGEGDRTTGELPAPVTLRAGDALALLSSNALALAQAALAGHETELLLRATHVVAALSLAAVSGSAEAYAAPVHALRPYPGPARAAAEVRRLLGLPDDPATGVGNGLPAADRRIQDPYGFRAFPQVHGAALEASAALRRIVETEINCPSENPVLTPDGHLYHHGGFFAAPLALALDGLNLALLKTAQLSAARLSALSRPDLTGLPAFLATGPAGSSGTMILEYTANSALAELRSSAAAPASAGHAVLSHGLEEAAGFAGQAARQTERARAAYATVLACELVSAVRALRLHPEPPAFPALTLAAAVLPTGLEDRPLSGDIEAATELLPRLAEF